MTVEEASAAGPTCAIQVFREGALSAFGHDLLLRAAGLTLEVESGAGDIGPTIRATCPTGSLRVVGSLRAGAGSEVDLGQPAAGDRLEIERTISLTILESSRFPLAIFRSSSVQATPAGYTVAGRLDLHGVERDLAFAVERQGNHLVARIVLDQTDFRIKPYRAMMGALRVKPEVIVEISVALADAGAGKHPPTGTERA